MGLKLQKCLMLGAVAMLIASAAHADRLVTKVYSSEGEGTQSLGDVVFEDVCFNKYQGKSNYRGYFFQNYWRNNNEDSGRSCGLLITPKLQNLKPNTMHGTHIHQMPDCGNHAMNAGAHFDPQNTNTHLGPFNKGHLGDLPLLVSDEKGNAMSPTFAPRLSTQILRGHAYMVHAGGDTYSDTPELGGGGARIGCGKIPAR